MKLIGCVLGVGLLLTPAFAREADGPKASELWLVPPRPSASALELAMAVQELANGKPAPAAGVFAKSAKAPFIGDYAQLYEGRANLALGQIDPAQKIAKRLVDLQGPANKGYLYEAALLFAADVDEAADDYGEAAHHLADALSLKPSSSAALWLRLGKDAVKAGERDKAASAFAKDYFDYPPSDQSAEAAKELAMPGMPGTDVTRDNYSRAKARAVALFDGRRFADARKAFDALKPFEKADDQELIGLRDAECDLNAKKYAAARDALSPFAAAAGSHQVEAKYSMLATLRGLNEEDAYVSSTRAFVAAFPTSPYAEDALNDLGSHFTTSDEDAKAADVFSEMYRDYPDGAHAERAAWRSGWWAFRTGNYGDTARIFDDAAVRMPHADTRPSWLYWAAKAHARAGERDAAVAGFRKTIANYRNLYYGREAARELKVLAASDAVAKPAAVPPSAEAMHVTAAPPPANADVISHLLEAGMWDEAMGELRYAERASGTTPLIQATQAYVWGKKGDLRTGITLMKRAYPQFMSVGSGFPVELERVIYPVAYWDLIQKYALAHNLDPSIMAALIAQESTFQPDIRSGANAWGLMQIVPATGRQYATHMGIKPFSTERLTDPLVNIRIGMAYFADLMKQFGNLPAALASYNAGESRAIRWLKERPGLPRDEFIDDIPFPETQGYVRRIIGTAEDYRRIYGTAGR